MAKADRPPTSENYPLAGASHWIIGWPGRVWVGQGKLTSTINPLVPSCYLPCQITSILCEWEPFFFLHRWLFSHWIPLRSAWPMKTVWLHMRQFLIKIYFYSILSTSSFVIQSVWMFTTSLFVYYANAYLRSFFDAQRILKRSPHIFKPHRPSYFRLLVRCSFLGAEGINGWRQLAMGI